MKIPGGAQKHHSQMLTQRCFYSFVADRSELASERGPSRLWPPAPPQRTLPADYGMMSGWPS